MQSLMLADDLFPSLLNDRKLCTVRAGKRAIDLGPLVFKSVSGKFPPVEVTVDRISYTRAELIAQREAIMDGARDPEELRTAMKRFYPDMNEETVVTIVEFSRVEKITKEEWYKRFYSHLEEKCPSAIAASKQDGVTLIETMSLLFEYENHPDLAADRFIDYHNEGIF